MDDDWFFERIQYYTLISICSWAVKFEAGSFEKMSFTIKWKTESESETNIEILGIKIPYGNYEDI